MSREQKIGALVAAIIVGGVAVAWIGKANSERAELAAEIERLSEDAALESRQNVLSDFVAELERSLSAAAKGE
jgi:outer membrane murein-binding lipoprotein Lpp